MTPNLQRASNQLWALVQGAPLFVGLAQMSATSISRVQIRDNPRSCKKKFRFCRHRHKTIVFPLQDRHATGVWRGPESPVIAGRSSGEDAMFKGFVRAAIPAVLIMAAAGCGQSDLSKLEDESATAPVAGEAAADQKIKIVGSSTVAPFSRTIAERFGATSSFPTPIVESTGTGGGFKAL